MKAAILGAAVWGPLGADAPTGGLPTGLQIAPEPPRPEAIPAGSWRRLSRVARLAAAATAPVLEGRTDLDTLPLHWGTLYGEFSSTLTFLRSLFTKGPAGASPLAFQNSVHNAPAGHLSIGFGLRGPSETICAGSLTTLRVVERAMCRVAATGAPALVVIGDDLGPDVRLGLDMAQVTAPVVEGAAALLIGPGEGLTLGPPEGTRYRRQVRWPGEAPVAPDGEELPVGIGAAAELMTLIALYRGAGGAVGFPGATDWLSVRPG